MKIQVYVYANVNSFQSGSTAFKQYVMDHDDQSQRRVLGEQCRNAFEGGQVIVTMPI